MAFKLDKIRKDRLSEVDEILDLFQGKLGLDDILNQDYSLITDLANIRDEKNAELLAQVRKPGKPGTVLEHIVGEDGNKNNNKTKSSVSKKKKRSV